jgi:hypothetical protein
MCRIELNLIFGAKTGSTTRINPNEVGETRGAEQDVA